MPNRKKQEDEKRISMNISVYKEDIEKVDRLADELGIKRSELIRELIKNASQSEVVKANIAYQLYVSYMEEKEEEWRTSHNGQNENIKTLHVWEMQGKENQLNNNQKNNGKQFNLSLEETRRIAEEMWKDD